MKRLRPIFRVAPDGSFAFNVKDLSQFRLILGRDVLRNLLACTIQVDRLLSLNFFMEASTKFFPENSIAQRRQFLTMLTFAAGTLRELAIALPKLRGVLMKRGLLKPGGWPIELAAIENRWEKTRSRIDIRDKVAFHLDLDRLDLAIDHAEKEKRKIYLEGDSEKSGDSWCRLGADAQVAMFGILPGDQDARAKTAGTEGARVELGGGIFGEAATVVGDIFAGIDTASAALDGLTLVVIGGAGMSIEGRDFTGPLAQRFNRAPGSIKLADAENPT